MPGHRMTHFLSMVANSGTYRCSSHLPINLSSAEKVLAIPFFEQNSWKNTSVKNSQFKVNWTLKYPTKFIWNRIFRLNLNFHEKSKRKSFWAYVFWKLKFPPNLSLRVSRYIFCSVCHLKIFTNHTFWVHYHFVFSETKFVLYCYVINIFDRPELNYSTSFTVKRLINKCMNPKMTNYMLRWQSDLLDVMFSWITNALHGKNMNPIINYWNYTYGHSVLFLWKIKKVK